MAHIVFAAFHSLSLFNKVLEKMDVKGLYALEDFEFDLNENCMWLYYAALGGWNQNVTQNLGIDTAIYAKSRD